ncbi:hypothetical protein PRIPAC_76863 [Pristionchus pacificus]|uniref:Uncharacterized protein n=1 Tax=Pristionchus pacificus TaxID=54126 RepID=A0A2A6CNA1_PRIPA|nr:hypothetical protein PRIPAC_76863 [Pristionchus pacificus]|eukprot:PDM79511.1 hypothetical protein PRIPAC_32090 [Pristionchus pacificus]
MFMVVSVVLTGLTSRQLYKIQLKVEVAMNLHDIFGNGRFNNNNNFETQTRKAIVAQQRKMFIIVAVCTFSHLIKAIHQFSWVFVAYFHLSELNAELQKTYVYPHYLATYSASVTLLIFSPRVRALLLSVKDVSEPSSIGTPTTTTSRPGRGGEEVEEPVVVMDSEGNEN